MPKSKPIEKIDFNDLINGGQEDNNAGKKIAQAFKGTNAHVEEIQKDIEAYQWSALENAEEDISWQFEAGGEKFGYLMNIYNREDKFHEYLVDGAILRCNQATLDMFELPAVDKFPSIPICLETEQDQNMDERLQTRLNVSENPIDLNNLTYATVNDTKKGKNILPFRCNCKIEAYRDEDKEKITAFLDACRKDGVCMYLMQLSEKWDNMPLPNGGSYLSKTDIDAEKIKASGEKAEGITMTSALFCKHGGIITPVTSGQNMVLTEEEKERILSDFNKENIEDIEIKYITLAFNGDPSDPEAVKRYMWDFFIKAGFPKAAVAGILGNVYAESGFNPTKPSNSGYIGLFQWGGEKRQGALKNQAKEWAKEKGFPEETLDDAWKNVEFQCRFALDEYINPGNHGWQSRGIDFTIYIDVEKYSEIYGTENEEEVIKKPLDIYCTEEEFEKEEDPFVAAMMWAASFERCCDKKDITHRGDNIYFLDIQDKKKRYEAAADIYITACKDNW